MKNCLRPARAAVDRDCGMRRMQRVPRKGLPLDRQRPTDPSATGTFEPMATPAPNVEPSVFSLSVWPLPAALVDRGQLAPFSFYSSTLRQAQPVSQTTAAISKGAIRIIGSPLVTSNE